MKSTHYDIILEDGDIHKIRLTTHRNYLRIAIYDGTGGQKNDLLIQGKLKEREYSRLIHAIREYHESGYFNEKFINWLSK